MWIVMIVYWGYVIVSVVSKILVKFKKDNAKIQWLDEQMKGIEHLANNHHEDIINQTDDEYAEYEQLHQEAVEYHKLNADFELPKKLKYRPANKKTSFARLYICRMPSIKLKKASLEYNLKLHKSLKQEALDNGFSSIAEHQAYYKQLFDEYDKQQKHNKQMAKAYKKELMKQLKND